MFNFQNKSLFKRNFTEDAEEEKQPVTGGMLAVWGSPGSGKTTVSVRLAEYLTRKKQDTLIIFADMTAPPVPCVLSPSELEWERSLGSILAASTVTDSLIKANCMFHKKNRYLSIVGMLKGENAYSYPEYKEKQARELIREAGKVADFIIIDCTSVIASDILSAVALMEADTVLRLVNCDLKSISYLSSQLPLLNDRRWDTEKQLKVASNIKQQEASSHIEQVLGSVTFRIPHSKEVEGQFLAGEMFGELGLKESRDFRREIEKIGKEVFGI